MLMLIVAAVTWTTGQRLPAVLAVVVALVTRLAWRMSGDLLPLWLELESDRLVVQTKRQRIGIALGGQTARRLTDDEKRYLARLASAGGIVAGCGGFDSVRLGEFDLYAANMENAVLVEAGEIRLVVTPDDPDSFLAALEVSSHQSSPKPRS